jgi:hypothetical protein
MSATDEHLIDHRRSTVPRRRSDLERVAILVGLLGLVLSGGIAWGVTQAAVAQKVDRGEFTAHVAEMKSRFSNDSIRTIYRDRQLERIEAKVDSGNARFSRFICDKKPAYCQ